MGAPACLTVGLILALTVPLLPRTVGVCVRTESYIRVYAHNIGESPNWMFTETSTMGAANDQGSSASVIGPARWRLCAASPPDGGVTSLIGHGDTANFGSVGNDRLSHVVREGPACVDRPVGVEATRLVPDAAMTTYNADPASQPETARLRYRENEIGSCQPYGWTHNDLAGSPGIEVDLGADFMVHAIATQGRADCSGSTATAFYYTSQYQVSYSRDGTTFTYVRNSIGDIMTFDGNTDTTYKDAVKNVLTAPIVARIIRVISTAGTATRGLRLEVYGCETGVTTAQYQHLAPQPDIRKALSGEPEEGVCVPTATGSTHATYTVTTGGYLLEFGFSVVFLVSDGCTGVDNMAVVVTVPLVEPVTQGNGSYVSEILRKCPVTSDNSTTTVIRREYHCACASVDLCSDVTVRVSRLPAEACVAMCEMRVLC